MQGNRALRYVVEAMQPARFECQDGCIATAVCTKFQTSLALADSQMEQIALCRDPRLFTSRRPEVLKS